MGYSMASAMATRAHSAHDEPLAHGVEPECALDSLACRIFFCRTGVHFGGKCYRLIELLLPNSLKNAFDCPLGQGTKLFSLRYALKLSSRTDKLHNTKEIVPNIPEPRLTAKIHIVSGATLIRETSAISQVYQSKKFDFGILVPDPFNMIKPLSYITLC